MSTYKIDDLILPALTLPEPCPIRIEVDEGRVRLYVGPRDWSWYRDGRLLGAGTCFCTPSGELRQSDARADSGQE